MSDVEHAAKPSVLRRIDRNGYLSLLTRVILGGMMIYLSYSKINQPVTFLKLIDQYDMVSRSSHLMINFTVVILPWVEMLGGIALIFGVLLRGTAAVMTLMLVGFTSVIFVRALGMVSAELPFTEVKFDCGCGNGEQIIWIKLLENLGLILCATWLVYARSRAFTIGKSDPPPHPNPDPTS
jgi:uncharacterized membrane protein YphA (DoxX/SURF4 family)